MSLPSDPPLQSIKRIQSKAGEELEIVHYAENWTPKDDLSLYYRRADNVFDWSILDFDWEKAASRAQPPGVNCPRLSPPSEDAWTASFDTSDLRLCRNAVFARHGKIFKDGALNNYFYGKRVPKPSSQPFFAWQPNPDFRPSDLFAKDWATLELIKEEQEIRRGKPGPDAPQPPTLKPDPLSPEELAQLFPKPSPPPAPSAEVSGSSSAVSGRTAAPDPANGQEKPPPVPAPASPPAPPAATSGCTGCSLRAPNGGLASFMLFAFPLLALCRRRRRLALGR